MQKFHKISGATASKVSSGRMDVAFNDRMNTMKIRCASKLFQLHTYYIIPQIQLITGLCFITRHFNLYEYE
jgi:hypothetical protein